MTWRLNQLRRGLKIIFFNRNKGNYMGVEPKIGGFTPKWMVKIMETPIKMDDLGIPLFLETPICIPWKSKDFFVYLWFFRKDDYCFSKGLLSTNPGKC